VQCENPLPRARGAASYPDLLGRRRAQHHGLRQGPLRNRSRVNTMIMYESRSSIRYQNLLFFFFSHFFFWLSIRHVLNRADLRLLREESQRMIRIRITQRTCEKQSIIYWLISSRMLTVACNVLVLVIPPQSIRRSQLIVLKMGGGTTHIRTGLIGNSLSSYMTRYAVLRGPQAHVHLGARMMKNRMNSLISRMIYHRGIIQYETDRFQTPHVRYSP